MLFKKYLESNHKNISFERYYQINNIEGAGSFGEVYSGLNLKNNEEIAIKVESSSIEFPQLFNETQIYQILNKDRSHKDYGIPTVKYCSREGDFNIMVMDLMGPNLDEVFHYCNNKFTIQTLT